MAVLTAPLSFLVKEKILEVFLESTMRLCTILSAENFLHALKIILDGFAAFFAVASPNAIAIDSGNIF